MPDQGVVRRLLGRVRDGIMPRPLPNPDTAKRFDKPALVTTGAWVSAFGGVTILPNPDEVIATQGTSEGLAFYRRIRRQVPFVAGLFKLRIDAACALPAAWIAGDEDDPASQLLRDIVADAWDRIPDSAAAERKLLLCIADGIGVGELVWEPYVVNVRPPQAAPSEPRNPLDVAISLGMVSIPCLVPRIIDRRPEFFHFDPDGDLYFRSPYMVSNEKTPLNPLQYIVARYGSADLYGDGEMREAYADIWKIDTIDKMALRALEKQGYPLLRVFVPEGWDDQRVERQRAAIARSYPNFILIPYGDRYEESIITGDAAPTYLGSDQIARIKALQDTISISILGTAFSNTEKGSYARDAVRNEMRFEKTANDAASRDAIRNDWCRKFCSVNFPSVPEALWPHSSTDSKPTEDLKAWMEAAVSAAGLGFPVSKKQVSEKQGLDIATDDADTLKKAVPVVAPPPTDNSQPTADNLPAPPSGDQPPDMPSIAVMNEAGDVVQFDDWPQFCEALGIKTLEYRERAPQD